MKYFLYPFFDLFLILNVLLKNEENIFFSEIRIIRLWISYSLEEEDARLPLIWNSFSHKMTSSQTEFDGSECD